MRVNQTFTWTLKLQILSGKWFSQWKLLLCLLREVEVKENIFSRKLFDYWETLRAWRHTISIFSTLKRQCVMIASKAKLFVSIFAIYLHIITLRPSYLLMALWWDIKNVFVLPEGSFHVAISITIIVVLISIFSAPWTPTKCCAKFLSKNSSWKPLAALRCSIIDNVNFAMLKKKWHKINFLVLPPGFSLSSPTPGSLSKKQIY